jgi:hypothetical protein
MRHGQAARIGANVMAKKRRKVYRKAEKRAKRVLKPRPASRLQCVLVHTQLRPIIREAARAGLIEAIEHTRNFWEVSDGYKKYIEQQIELQSEALMAAVKTAIREELLHTVVRSNLRKKSTK